MSAVVPIDRAPPREIFDAEALGWRHAGAAKFALALGPSAELISSFGAVPPTPDAEFGWPVERIDLSDSNISIAIMLLCPHQGCLTAGRYRYGLASAPRGEV